MVFDKTLVTSPMLVVQSDYVITKQRLAST
jgi:hypothetical protein